MKIAIIGAGIGGLCANHELVKRGHDVVVYEATERAGGRGRLMNRPDTDDWADVGSQYFVEGYDNILRIIDEVGLSHKRRKVNSIARIFTKEGSNDHFDFNPKVPWMAGGTIADNLRLIFYSAKLLLTNKSEKYAPSPRGNKLDNIRAIDSTDSKFLQDNLLRMATRTGLLNDLEASEVHMLHLQHQMASYGSNPLVTLEEGTASLHRELASRADIRYNSPVKALNEVDGRVTGFTLETGEEVVADHVFVVANGVHAAKLVPDSWELEKRYLSKIEQTPTIIVSLFLSEETPNDVLSYFLPFDADTTVSYCTDANQKGTGNAPSGKTTLQAWIVNPKAADLLDTSDEELVQIARRDIVPYMPYVDNLIEGYAITRHKHTVPQFRVGHNEETHDFMDAIDAREGVSFCGDYISNGNMESSVWTVMRAIDKLNEANQLAA